jgi:hypothetical protein
MSLSKKGMTPVPGDKLKRTHAQVEAEWPDTLAKQKAMRLKPGAPDFGQATLDALKRHNATLKDDE